MRELNAVKEAAGEFRIGAVPALSSLYGGASKQENRPYDPLYLKRNSLISQ